MTDQIPIDHTIARITLKLRETLGVRGKDLRAALGKARHRLPRRIYRQALVLAQAEPLG